MGSFIHFAFSGFPIVLHFPTMQSSPDQQQPVILQAETMPAPLLLSDLKNIITSAFVQILNTFETHGLSSCDGTLDRRHPYAYLFARSELFSPYFVRILIRQKPSYMEEEGDILIEVGANGKVFASSENIPARVADALEKTKNLLQCIMSEAVPAVSGNSSFQKL